MAETHHADSNQNTDREAYLAGMRQLGAAVSVITVGDTEGGETTGLTATAVCSVSADPPTLLVCVNASGESHDHIHATGHFCVNVLAADQHDIAMLFADPARKDDRFNETATTVMPSGCPAINGAVAQFDCKLDAAHPGSSHTIFVGKVLECRSSDGMPLLYQQGSFGTFTAFD